MTSAIADQRVGEFIDAVASDAPTPGGGAVVGAVAALAGALTGMAGRYAVRSEPGSLTWSRLVEHAGTLRVRALELGDADAAAYSHYVEVSADHSNPESRKSHLRGALAAAAAVPLALGGVAAEIADLAEQLAVTGNPRLRTDARTAALLAAAVATSTALLVEENLAGFLDDPRVDEAANHARAAAAAAARALGDSSLLERAPA